MYHLFSPHKYEYVRGKARPSTECIFCSLLENKVDQPSLLIYRNTYVALAVNLYPYNSGHLLLFPVLHHVDLRELCKIEEEEMNRMLKVVLDKLSHIYHPDGFNIGWNQGEFSGASIAHIHQHIIPRYKNELGFIDIIGGAKILVEDPSQTLEKLKQAFTE